MRDEMTVLLFFSTSRRLIFFAGSNFRFLELFVSGDFAPSSLSGDEDELPSSLSLLSKN
jgi:hypothetical protein